MRRTCGSQADIDVAAVCVVADRIRNSAGHIDDAVSSNLARLAFGANHAGRAYIGRGDALRTGLESLAAELSQWSRATCEIAVALRAGADRYIDAEMYAAARIV